MSKHTPGPWHIGTGADGWPLISTDRKFDAYLEIVASVYRPTTHVRMAGTPDCHEANAALIAAAPCMYEALKSLLSEWDALGFSDDDGNPKPDNAPVAIAARAALAKAEGR